MYCIVINYTAEELVEEIRKSRATKESQIGTLQNDILQLQGLENTVSKHVKPKLPPASEPDKKGKTEILQPRC